MPAIIPFDQRELILQSSEVYTLAAAHDILSRMADEVVDESRYPDEFIDGLQDSLTFLGFLIEQSLPQLSADQ